MNKQDQLEELLVDWELQRQQGNELSADEICDGNLDLVPELTKLIKQFKATDWLEEDHDYDDDFIHLPDFSTVSGHAEETRLPECSLTVEEFCQRIISSRLMDEEQVGRLKQRFDANDARSFAVQLVSEKQLTRFQATVLLEGRDIPLVLDRYVLLGEIGAGGMGAVYKALHQQMDRVVALKILPKEAVDSPDKVKRFQREVRAAAKLEHGNIVTAFDATESNGTHFLVMSYVNGSDLSQTVRKHGPVSAAKAVSYIAQAASGLEHAHNMGIVHRDIKPGNLLLDKKGKVQILDMGLARIETADAEYDKTVTHELTQAGTVMGTIAYLAPEQALDSRHADGRSDIYSLGCTLYYLLTGKALYIEDTMMKTILAHREAEIPSLCEERESVPVELDAIFQKMVAKQPENRFQNMTEVISALDELEMEDDKEAQPVVTSSQAYHDTATFIDTSRDVIETQPGSKSFDPPKRSWPLVASGVFGFIVLLAVITIVTKKGTVTVNIPEQMKDGVQVKIQPTDGGDRAVAVLDKDNNWTVTLSGGEYTVDLQGGQDEFHIEDDNLSVSRFGKSVVEITFTPAEQIAATNGMAGPDAREITPTVAPPEENWALEFSGKASYVETPLKFDGSHPITIDVRVQPKQESPKGQALISTAHFGGFELKIDEKRKGYCATAFYGRPDKRSGSYRSTGVGSVAYGGWSTLSMVLDEDRFDLYLDGVRLPEDSTKFQGGFKPSSLPVYFGGNAEPNAPPVWLYQGRLDEIRISKTARYTKDFTPEKRFKEDEHTLALYHFDSGSGDVLKDSSGNGHHGKIVGAKWVKVDDELKVIEQPQTPSSPKTTHIWPKDQPAPAIAPFNAEQAKAHQEAWAKHLGIEVETTNSIGMKFRVIPPGEFLMGSSEEEIAKLLAEAKEQQLGEKELKKIQSEGPQHRVILTKPFSSSTHEVTRGQFRQFVETTGYQTDAEKEGKGGIGDNVEQADGHPVVNVSWNDAVMFCEWLSEKENLIFRLPTEAEWEYTCRAGSLDRFSFGNEESLLGAYAWYGVNSGYKTKPVGQKTANALGMFDMYGNVREWCGDRLGMYENTIAIDPLGPTTGSSRALRGGTNGYPWWVVRSAHRISNLQSKSSGDCGFRIVRTFEKYKSKTTHDQPAPVPDQKAVKSDSN